MPKLLVALAAADLITLITSLVAALLTLFKMPNASLTSLFLTKSITNLTLRGVVRMFLAIALASVGVGLAGLTFYQQE